MVYINAKERALFKNTKQFKVHKMCCSDVCQAMNQSPPPRGLDFSSSAVLNPIQTVNCHSRDFFLFP